MVVQLSVATLELFHVLFGKNMQPVVQALLLQHITIADAPPNTATEPRASVFEAEINRSKGITLLNADIIRLLHVVPPQLKSAETEESYQTYFTYARMKAC